jgi:carbon storage regulator
MKQGVIMNKGRLVLTRKVGQKVIIGDDIVVEIIQLNSENVKLSFVAPTSLPIHREEIFARIQPG